MGLDFVAPLFVPGDRPDRFSKAAARGADAVIIDLEDAVAAENKNKARASIRADFTALPVVVRVNGRDTAWFDDDVAALTERTFAGVMMPKAENADFLRDVHKRTGMPVIALIETARGVANARRIAETEGVARVAFGSIDFCADMGCGHVREALLLARLELVLASRLAGLLAPLDGVTASIDAPQDVSDDARYSRSLGFGGKLCIHPSQIAPALEGFRPTDTEIAWAKRVLEPSSGAVKIDGKMIDEPVRTRARSILARIRSLEEQ
ncbi:CoA ester lyase [Rhizobium sp. AN80A]|uniref:HpcH/HpaI aldolase/citrate lyase family protein n=1 Tax=Rhizobium sp. AN80A TaxID=3040673 RepID=UPI0024B38A9B|nr:CoA ester lyase [Rhizobium sp. AN80A]